MTQQLPVISTTSRVRIASHVTQSRFLHVEDSLKIGKVRLFAGTYRKGTGMQEFANFYQDIADARVVFAALAEGRDGFQYKEYKGTPGKNGSGAESRVLSVAVKEENVYMELKAGPGKETPTGAITPAGAARVAVNVTFKRHEAQRLALTTLAYMQAWDVLRMMAHRQMVGGLRPYMLAPTEPLRHEEETIRTPQAPIRNPARPLTRKGVVARRVNGNGGGHAVTAVPAVPPSPATAVPAAPPPAVPSARVAPLPMPTPTYGNGSRVDAANVTEMQTFAQYVEEKKAVPESKPVLLAYYQQRALTGPRAQGGD